MGAADPKNLALASFKWWHWEPIFLAPIFMLSNEAALLHEDDDNTPNFLNSSRTRKIVNSAHGTSILIVSVTP